MLQDDLALTEVVKSLSEQLQQVQSQQAEQQATIREQQATIVEQARQIGALTKNVAKQDEQIDRLTDNFARLEAEHKVIAALHVQDNGTGCCMSYLDRSVLSRFQQSILNLKAALLGRLSCRFLTLFLLALVTELVRISRQSIDS